MNKKLIIFTDIGDTIIDETTEVRKEDFGIVYSAECIPGAKETFLTLYQQGYTIVMVADGLERSFHNTMEENGLDHIFSEWVISEQIGIEKPSGKMFATAMQRMNLTDRDKHRIIMIGNHKLKGPLRNDLHHPYDLKEFLDLSFLRWVSK